VPANVTALVAKSQPGEELTCTTREHTFEQQETPVKHGVMSYYASQALAQATSIESLLKLIDQIAEQDIKFSRLPKLYLPSLQILGNANVKLPGKSLSLSPVDARPE
jgi:hypothetical protein